ncbi:MAG: NACHT domain-containing protein [Caldilineaceae bacterium]
MDNRYLSLEQQIVDLETSLRLIEERKSEFVDPTTIPLDLIKAEREKHARLEELIAQRALLSDVECPYRGLEVFQEEHESNFCGRSVMVEALVNKLRLVNFVAVIGVSGSGKSSLVRAGLIPALRRGALPGSATWKINVFRPGADPLTSFFALLAGYINPNLAGSEAVAETRRLADGLLSGKLQFGRDILPQIEAEQPVPSRFLLVVDQFEEVFDPQVDQNIRRHFLQAIVQASSYGRFKLVITLRANYFDAALQEQGLREEIVAGQVTVLPMNEQERRDAVMLPALKAGRDFEPGLVDRILQALDDAAGELPLLEFAMTQLWERQTATGLLTHAAYEEIGAVAGAIARHASAVYTGAAPEQRQLFEQLCKRLVSIDGEDSQPERLIADATVRRVDMDDLDDATQTLVRDVLDVQRLVVIGRNEVTGGESVELVHEALIRSWPQLGEWIVEDAPNLRMQQQLADAVQVWERFRRAPELLFRGDRLKEIESWRAAHAEVLTAREIEFVDASIAARRRRRLTWAAGVAAAIVVIGVLIAVAINGYLPDQPSTMPPDHFNIAVAHFAVTAVPDTDQATLDMLRRDADSFSNNITADLQNETPALKSSVFGDDVTVWGPAQLAIDVSQPISVQEAMKQHNVNVLVSGQVEKGFGRFWTVQPYYFANDAVFSGRVGELLGSGRMSLGTPVSYLAGNQESIQEAEAELQDRLLILGQFLRGLAQYDLGTEEGYRAAKEIFCAASPHGPHNDAAGSDLLLLFCGHANNALANMVGVNDHEYAGLLAASETAYREGLAVAPGNARLTISLAASLFSRGRPPVLDCQGADARLIRAAQELIDEFLDRASGGADVPVTALMEAHNMAGQVHFWLGFCFELEQREEHWQLAEQQYKAALAVQSRISPDDHYALRAAGDAELHAGKLQLMRFFTTEAEAARDQARSAALTALADSVNYYLQLGDNEAIKRAADAVSSSIILQCASGHGGEALVLLAQYDGKVADPDRVKTEILTNLPAELKKGCGL